MLRDSSDWEGGIAVDLLDDAGVARCEHRFTDFGIVYVTFE
jgi:hypothetical protein